MFFYIFILFGLLIYSYVLVDPNLTLINHPFWNEFRNNVISIGYYQRGLSWYIYFILIAFLFIVHFNFLKHLNKCNPLKIALVIGIILIFSYPFLSHDFFNYLFDAKIFTYYHQNPYLKKALDFPHDPWIRFMHWTHRTYPYGPVFLGLSLIPSFLSFGKFILSFVFFKVMITVFYLLAVFFLQKMNKKWAIIFATHPLIIIEGLVNGHNDLIALSLGIIGVYFLSKNKNILARLILLSSFGIKYITLPAIFLKNKSKIFNIFLFLFQIAIIGYLSFTKEIQSWYFLSFLIFLPFLDNHIQKLNIFFFGLLLSYYPFIYLGGWNNKLHIDIKHEIIIISFFVNVIYLFIKYVYKNKKIDNRTV